MSFLSDKRKEHASLTIRALKANNYADALFHAVKTAEYGFDLAEQTDGKVAQAYVEDANEWLAIGSRIKDKIRSGVPACQSDQQGENKESENPEKPSTAVPWLMTEKPDIRLDDVAGLDEVKRVIREDILNAMEYKDAYQMCKIPSGGGALMYGPPGNGKTFIARAIAGELDAAFFSASGAQIKNKYVGETEKNMRLLFEEAAKYERAVIFLDEIHSILARRGREKVSAVDEFLVMADGIAQRKNSLLILGATNYPWMLDFAVFRRLEKRVYVGLPDLAAREKIFTLNFKDVPVAEDFSCAEFAEKAGRFSGADIARICTDSKKRAVGRMIDSSADQPLVTKEDVLAALDAMKPTVSPELIQQYRDWEESFSKGGTFDAGTDDD
ncbi:MAG: ATP-binding protein [Thermoguttaceae bacterium]|nr:ATP-binding protein [Thermoguttaceae bacterium]